MAKLSTEAVQAALKKLDRLELEGRSDRQTIHLAVVSGRHQICQSSCRSCGAGRPSSGHTDQLPPRDPDAVDSQRRRDYCKRTSIWRSAIEKEIQKPGEN